MIIERMSPQTAQIMMAVPAMGKMREKIGRNV